MRFSKNPAPYIYGGSRVSQIMYQVIYGLLPALLVYVWYFGYGILINIILAGVTGLMVEGLMLLVRKQPLSNFLLDGSALVTSVLLAFSLPPLVPWWLPLIGTSFALIFAKHLYGGLGYNPFNPAMVGYVLLLISFPLEMTQWLLPHQELNFHESLNLVFYGITHQNLGVDSFSSATILDQTKTQLNQGKILSEIQESSEGWWQLNLSFLLGGLWLLYKKVIYWQIPAGFIASLTLFSAVIHFLTPDHYPTVLFHVMNGGTLLGAFFIATDPVTGPASPKGRLIYGIGIGCLTYIIRTWGGYPDGIAFAVLLMNMTVPIIDQYTQPRAFGHK
ncbi:RnfABCDGE type electron transport complex subunit D [Candidatus Nitrosacidococcus sp. I8]|uniref:RnfABCDGE type electron transport complex subunit D n=1 Tax=Candidatus Nitrosacidococcus sp. I8 TaxID=2942908 RepID=UPI002226A8EA|nr:RnfABCDGE type electron transport complex subunit D [Candidatus Nitrosacidococcus sp. I8]CAH9018306.1 Ion-translocating oxidoreductase complex subunit D [Candidatus Nitrosacidococcus sp. I8]